VTLGTWTRWLVGLAALAAIGSIAPVAAGAPQANAGLTIGGGTGAPGGGGGLFHLGARADVLFLRERGTDMAIGPYVDFATASFSTLEAGAGAEWLLPVRDDLPLVVSAGAFERRAPGFAWEPGAEATLFFGSRSYNFHSWYELVVGVFAQGRYGLGDARQREIIFGLQFDFALLAYPFVFAYEALRR
jgi:hypothetical protein